MIGLPYTALTNIFSDSGYIEHPVTTSTIISGISERYEVVIDLSAYRGQTIHVRNARDFSRNEDFAKTDYVMRIIVGSRVLDTNNNNVPADLVNLDFPTDTGALTHRNFQFHVINGVWKINGTGFADQNRTLAKPTPGSTEIWKLENPSGGWSMYHKMYFDVVEADACSIYSSTSDSPSSCRFQSHLSHRTWRGTIRSWFQGPRFS